jgi:hypothetical protein
LGLALAKFLQRKRRDSVAPFLEIRLATSHWLSAASRLLQLLVKFAGRAGNINPARDTALAILGPLHDAGIFPAFRASGGFAGVHDLLTVRCLCDLRHILLLTGMCRRPRAAVLPGVWGVTPECLPAGWARSGSVRLYSPPQVYMTIAKISQRPMSVARWSGGRPRPPETRISASRASPPDPTETEFMNLL